ncbi:MAG: peptide-methionine (R)-S-oxide reductase MsrB, partial [Candidatus Kapabacteria bacterium]|nr:peptide-methionine (R)-S-oxide reductase MsrB [Candidatus Kapabacteria bacterium]
MLSVIGNIIITVEQSMPSLRHIVLIALAAVLNCTAIASCGKPPKQAQQAGSSTNDSTLRMKPEYTAHLTQQEYNVLVNKATDAPSEGGYTNLFDEGEYHCRACGALLYKSDAKFKAHCGWAAFDTEVKGAVRRIADNSHGMIRTEILCTNCGGHLGHVFEGEGYTATDTRHCVNTSSLIFHPVNKQTVYVALGDFHSVQTALQNLAGVLYTETGYANFDGTAPSYEQVANGTVKAVQVVKVEFDPKQLTPEALASQLRERAAKAGAGMIITTGDAQQKEYETLLAGATN